LGHESGRSNLYDMCGAHLVLMRWCTFVSTFSSPVDLASILPRMNLLFCKPVRRCSNAASPAQYYTMPRSLEATLQRATVELHSMFVAATREVLRTPALWPSFGFPASFWPRAQAALQASDKLVCGRFDFSASTAGGTLCVSVVLSVFGMLARTCDGSC
jgi:hypothetical protein